MSCVVGYKWWFGGTVKRIGKLLVVNRKNKLGSRFATFNAVTVVNVFRG